MTEYAKIGPNVYGPVPTAPTLAQATAREEFLKVAEVATRVRTSRMTIYRLIHTGELPAVQIGRSFRVPAAAVDAYLTASEVSRD